MVDILEWISGVLQECHTIRDDRFIDQLDTISLNVKSCCVELGELLHEMMLSPQPLDENQFSTLLELTQCVAELANYYESIGFYNVLNKTVVIQQTLRFTQQT